MSVMRFLIGGFLSLFEARHPLLSLGLISLLAGVVMLWVFRRVSNQGAIRVAKKRLQAHLYELRLFADEPRLVWRAQKGTKRTAAREPAVRWADAAPGVDTHSSHRLSAHSA
jgi:hypothetical protein